MGCNKQPKAFYEECEIRGNCHCDFQICGIGRWRFQSETCKSCIELVDGDRNECSHLAWLGNKRKAAFATLWALQFSSL